MKRIYGLICALSLPIGIRPNNVVIHNTTDKHILYALNYEKRPRIGNKKDFLYLKPCETARKSLKEYGISRNSKVFFMIANKEEDYKREPHNDRENVMHQFGVVRTMHTPYIYWITFENNELKVYDKAQMDSGKRATVLKHRKKQCESSVVKPVKRNEKYPYCSNARKCKNACNN